MTTEIDSCIQQLKSDHTRFVIRYCGTVAIPWEIRVAERTYSGSTLIRALRYAAYGQPHLAPASPMVEDLLARVEAIEARMNTDL